MDKKLKLSPWHDGSVKPVHVGFYEVECKCCGGLFRVKWCDKKFIGDDDLIPRRWRGVLK